MSTMENGADLRELPDEALDLEAALRSRKVSALRYATSAAGIAMLQAFRARLDQVRAEIEGRACD